jgi:hypothetical protein
MYNMTIVKEGKIISACARVSMAWCLVTYRICLQGVIVKHRHSYMYLFVSLLQ